MKRRSAFVMAAAAWPLPTSAVIADHDGLAWLSVVAWTGFALIGGVALLQVSAGMMPRSTRWLRFTGRPSPTLELDPSTTTHALPASAVGSAASGSRLIAETGNAAAWVAATATADAALPSPAVPAKESSAPPVFFASWDSEALGRSGSLPPGAPSPPRLPPAPILQTRPPVDPLVSGTARGERDVVIDVEAVDDVARHVEVTIGLARLEALANGAPPLS